MNRLNELAVGIVFFVALGILGYFTIIKGDFFDTRPFYYMTALFQNVEGMEEGSKVLVNGVDSGVVDSIALHPDGVQVKLKMYNRFTMYENYTIMMKNVSALGGKFISVNPGSPFVNNRKQMIIETRENLDGLSSGDPLTLLAELIAENRNDIRATISNVRSFTEKINSDSGTLGKLLGNDELHENTNDLVEELRDTVEDAREQAPVTSFIRAALTVF